MDENKMLSNSFNNYGCAEQMHETAANGCLDESSTNNEQFTENSKTSLSSRICIQLSKRKLELFTFLFTFSSVMTNVTSTTMILRKVCVVHLEFNTSVCTDLENENYSDVKNSVEKLAANYQLGHTLIQTAPAAVLAMFIGPWSDRYGRKGPIIVALTGMLVDSLGSTICAYFLYTRTEYYFIPPLFTGLSGGVVTVMAVVYSYCSDSTALFDRTMKYAFIEMAVGCSTSFGTTAGGWIFKGLGFAAVFLFTAGSLIITLLFGIFMIEETRGLDNDEPWSTKMRDLASSKICLEGLSAITKHRPDRGRRQVVLLIISLCFLIIAMNSTGDINYLYAHHLFGWDNTTYSNITSIYAIIGIAVLVVVIPLLKRFKITDAFLGLMGTLSLVGKSLGVGLSRNKPIYHIANVAGFLGGCATFAARARISKIARDDDVGKLFTFVATAESLLPIFTSVLMSQLFVAFLSSFPGMPYITLGIFLLLPLGVFRHSLIRNLRDQEKKFKLSISKSEKAFHTIIKETIPN